MRILLLLFVFISSTFVQAQNIHIGAQSGMKNYNYDIVKIGYYPVYRTNRVDTVCSHTYMWYEWSPRKCMKCGEPEKDSVIRMPGTYSLPNIFLPITYPGIYYPQFEGWYEWPKSYPPIQFDTATYWPATDSVTYLPVTDSVFRSIQIDTVNSVWRLIGDLMIFDTVVSLRTDSIPLAPKEPTRWINIDTNRLIAQAFDTNHKETGYISYYRQSDRYTTRGSVKQAVKALYAFIVQEMDFATVYMLFVDAINDDGTIKDQALYYRAVQQMRIIRQRYGL